MKKLSDKEKAMYLELSRLVDALPDNLPEALEKLERDKAEVMKRIEAMTVKLFNEADRPSPWSELESWDGPRPAGNPW